MSCGIADLRFANADVPGLNIMNRQMNNGLMRESRETSFVVIFLQSPPSGGIRPALQCFPGGGD